MNKKKIAAIAFKNTIPVLTGYIFLGMGYGILLEKAGFGVIWALLSSTLIFAGSLQYVLIPFMGGGVSLVTVLLTSVMVNARHVFYGISMIDRYRDVGRFKPYLIFALSDETYSLVVNPPVMPVNEQNHYFLFVSAFDQCYWIIGSVLGSLIGSMLNFNTQGIDFVLTALFVTIVTDQWLKSKNHYSAIAGIVCSAVCLAVCRIFFDTDNFLIPAMIAIAVALIAGKRFTGEYAKTEETPLKEAEHNE